MLLIFILCIACSIVSTAQNLLRPNIEGPSGLQVNSYTGSLFYQRTDMFIPGRGLSLEVTLSYNSADRRMDYGYGYGWTSNYNQFYKDSAGGLVFYRMDGRKDYYTKNGSSFTAPKGIFDLLTQESGFYVLTAKDGTKYYFENAAHKKLTRIRERNNNEIKITYSGNTISTITDASGRSLKFTWNGIHVINIKSEAASPAHSVTYFYDNAGNLVYAQDAKQQKISYIYGADRVMTSLKDAVGNEIKITYTVNNAVYQIISCLAIKTIAYNPDNGTVAVSDQTNGRTLVTTYSFDFEGRLGKRTGNCCGYNTSYGYDTDNNITKITDANGNQYLYGYDGRGNLTSETDPFGKTIFYTYEGKFNQVTSIRDKRGYTISFGYDERGNLTKKTYPLGIIQEYEYDVYGNMTKFTDGRKKVITYEPDNYGYLKSRTDSAGITYYIYDVWGNMTYIKDANGHETEYFFDVINQLEKIQDAKGKLTQYFYDANGNLEKLIDANNHPTEYQYDAYDNLIYIKDALNYTTSFTYDGMGSMLTRTDANGHTTRYEYDKLNRLIAVINPLFEATYYSYDGNGNRMTVQYPNGNTVIATYDALNRVEKLTDQLGTLVSYSYDANNNKLSQSNGIGNTTSYKYDALNRLEYEYDAIGNAYHYEYDFNSNLTKKTDRNNNPTNYYYDALNRLDYMVDALSYITDYGYDAAGNLTSVKDAKGNITKYDYDELNRKTDEIFADLTTKHFEYDNVGNLLSRKDNNGVITSYVYDNINRLTERQYPGSTESFTYDAEGKMKSAVNGNATVEFDYDFADRLLSEKLNGKQTSYVYNIAGKTKTINYPNGRTIIRQVDGRNHLLNIQEGSSLTAEFAYNNAGQNTSRKFLNGTSNIYNYTDRGQINNLGFTPSHFSDVSYNYDKEANPTSASFTNGILLPEQYGYDKINRLTSFTKTANDQSFNYDGVGNRTTATIAGVDYSYSTDNMNAYTGITYVTNTINPLYDDNGNTTYDGVYNYDYDVESRITKVNNGTTATYKYDALGRRIQKATATDTINYYFDGLQVIEERNQNDITVATYTWGTWLDDIVSTNRNNTAYYYNTNLIGSVVSITDAQGALTERYEYDAFGKQSIYNAAGALIIKSSIGNTYSFTGRQIDNETGLYYYRARYYDAVLGRFLQRDPLGYVDGFGLYIYVSNIPTSYVDPMGTESLSWCCKVAKFASDQLNGIAGDIQERSQIYKSLDLELSQNGVRWYGAASIVTQWNAIGAAERVNLWYLNNEADKFLIAGNAYLFPKNIANYIKIRDSKPISDFIDGNGNLVSMKGLRGKDLDYALVQLEQTLVQKFIDDYEKKHGGKKMEKIKNKINGAFSSECAPSEVKKALKNKYVNGNAFDFMSYEDRVYLGQRLIDQLH